MRSTKSRALVWFGACASFLCGALVTAAQELPSSNYQGPTAAEQLRAVHEGGYNHAGVASGLAREIADYLKGDRANETAAPPPRVAQLITPAQGQSGYVGQQTCISCHAQENANWAHTIHAKVFELNPGVAVEDLKRGVAHLKGIWGHE